MGIGAVVSEPSYHKDRAILRNHIHGRLVPVPVRYGHGSGKKAVGIKAVGIFLVCFGIAMPLIGAICGLLVGHFWLGYSVGGVTLVTVLAASCSYIAVPPAMRLAVPEANPSFYLTLSLGVYFSV